MDDTRKEELKRNNGRKYYVIQIAYILSGKFLNVFNEKTFRLMIVLKQLSLHNPNP